MSNPEIELEASYFACALLMPKELFVSKYHELRKTVKREDTILRLLAKHFDVPLFAVALRIKMIE